MLRKGEVGVASFYGKEFKGRKTASGHYFDPEGMTAAHRNLPLGTQVRITNLNNGRSYEALINDRGPFVPGRIIDVSRGLAEKLGFIRSGIAKVKIEVMGWEPLKSLRAAVVAMESPPRRGKTTLARRDD
jgi:rare lipoprotein A